MSTKRHGDMGTMYPYRKDDSGKPLCRGCGGALPKGRSAWCSDKCNIDAMVSCWPTSARNHVWARDHGICAQCGTNTVRLRKRFKHWGVAILHKWGHAKWNEWQDRWHKKYGHESWWHADHILPVVEGGGNCGLDNYRTLCIPCHKKETKELAARRAKARRKKKPEQLILFEVEDGPKPHP